MPKEISSIPDDIYNLLDPETDHEVNEDNLLSFVESLADVLRMRLHRSTHSSSGLRFSALGRPNRQVWYDNHPVDGGKEAITGRTAMKFLYGDVIEAVLLFLTKEAGHDVSLEQAEVEVAGVKGHIDAKIDGVIVDVKSASPFGYKKFKDGTVTEDDPFGYVDQLAGYANVLTPGEDAAWLAMDKVSGDICVSTLSKTVIKHHQPADRIAELQEVITSAEPPPLCYVPIPDGKSGNEKLPTACSYCSHKYRCHPSVRVFLYSTGPRFLTTVAKTPDVIEVDPRMIPE